MQTCSMKHSRKSIYGSRVKSSPYRGQTEKCRKNYGCKKYS